MVPFRSMLVFLLLACGQTAASEFTVDDWRVSASIIADDGGFDGGFFDGVANPFFESHSYDLQASSVSASYDFAWDETGGCFSIESQIAAELVSGGSNRASTHGWILITPSVDLAFHIDATMDFDLPGHIMKAVMDVKAGAGHTLYDGYRQHDTFSDGIGSGTLSSSGDIILSAGRTWGLAYDLSVDTYDYEPLPGSVGEIGTATSSVCFSFTVLPEPSTLGLLAIAGCMMLRHKRKPQAPPTAKTPS